MRAKTEGGRVAKLARGDGASQAAEAATRRLETELAAEVAAAEAEVAAARAEVEAARRAVDASDTVDACVEINQCVGCCHAIEQAASMAWRKTRGFSTNAQF